MTLDPRVRRLVKLANRLERHDPSKSMPERRAASLAMAKRGRWLVMPSGPAMASERDLEVPVAGGKIVVRLYVPPGGGPLPLHVFLHGGGWCVGSLLERDPRCRQIASGARCAVASVDYRLAPENAFPTAAEDCYAALSWLVDHARELGFDASRVSVGGESAGANLAAAVCLMARDRQGPALCFQWLDVPAVDSTMSQPTIHSVPDGYLLDMAVLLEFRGCYLPDDADYTHPYASPLLADSHEGLPPAWIMSCEYDKLRSDGEAYAAALEAAGVPVQFQILAGHVHPSFAFTRVVPSAKRYEQEAIAALSAALHA